MKPLSDVHILVVEDSDTDRQLICAALAHAGAIPHGASNRTTALGLYFNLYADDIIPRAVVTDWYINPPSSLEHAFYKLIGCEEDNTALNLIRRIRNVDKDVAIVIHSAYLDEVPAWDLAVRTIAKGCPMSDLVDMLASDPIVLRQKDTHRSRSGVLSDARLP